MKTEITTYNEIIQRAKRRNLNLSLTSKRLTLDWARRTAKARNIRRKLKAQ